MPSTVEIVIKGVDQASGAFASANKSAGGLQAGLAKIGGGIVKAGLLGVAGTVAAIGGSLALCIGPASDLNETVSKVGVVFGEQASKVLGFAEDSATALGMTKNQALAAAGTYGNLFRSMGMAEETSAGMSTSLVQLAADLASFNNIDPTEALEKLRAGLVGESEPLKSLGVNLNEDAIKTKALQMGLGNISVDMAAVQQKTVALEKAQAGAAKALEKHGEGSLEYRNALAQVEKAEAALEKAQGGKAQKLSASAKAQAAYALIMEQTSLAQGDFARTSGGLANQQRILTATFGDLRAKIGTKLLPVMTTFTGLITRLTSSPQFQKWLDRLIEGLGGIADKVVAVVDAFTTGGLEGGLKALFGPEAAAQITGILDVFRPVVDAFTSGDLEGGLGQLGAKMQAWVGTNLPAWLEGLGRMGLGLVQWIGDAIPGLLAAAGNLGVTLIGWISSALPGLLTAFGTWARAAISWVLEALPRVLTALGNLTQKLIGKLMDALPDWAKALLKFGIEAVQWIVAQLPGLAENLGKFFNRMVTWVVENLPAWIAKLQEFAMEAIDWVVKALPGLGENLGQMAGTLLRWIGQTIIDIAPELLKMAAKFIGWVASDVLPKLPTVLGEILVAILNFIAGMLTAISPELGKVAQGIVDSLAKGIRDAAKGVHKAIMSALSPSYGGPTVEVTGGWNVPTYQKGGLVSGLLGAPQLAVVHGGEFIVPAGRAGTADRGGRSISITIGAIHVPSGPPERVRDAARVGVLEGLRAAGLA